jgi:hypothetical protein
MECMALKRAFVFFPAKGVDPLFGLWQLRRSINHEHLLIERDCDRPRCPELLIETVPKPQC